MSRTTEHRINTGCKALLLILAATTTSSALAETMEERLRNQLRSTTQQLQTLQSEQAQSNAARASAEAQLAAAQAQIKKLTADLAKASGQAESLAGQQTQMRESAQALVAASNERAGKFKQAYDELLERARGIEQQRGALEGQLTTRNDELQQCTVKNQDMYGIAKDILDAYENISVSEVMNIRQPFAGSARVKFEELAQRYGDELYKTRSAAASTLSNP